jgi:hypothetical protein
VTSALFGVPRAALGGIAEVTEVATFPASVTRWAGLVKKHAGSLPIPFLLAWIKKESGGNPCSYTTLRESGIFQLMYGGNLDAGGTTEAALRGACIGTTQSASRALTAQETEEQVRSGIQYVNYARDYARKYVNWPESSVDFWNMVKMVHVAPARVKQYAPGASSWAEFRRRAEAGGNTPAHWLDNAEWVGRFGEGGGGSLVPVVLVGLVAAGALFYLRGRRR